jgi:hypothetical protein
MRPAARSVALAMVSVGGAPVAARAGCADLVRLTLPNAVITRAQEMSDTRPPSARQRHADADAGL